MALVQDLGWDLARALDLEEGSEREGERLEVSARRAAGSSEGGARWRLSRDEKPGSSARSAGHTGQEQLIRS
jgi:hypothetical protein